jgi:hypothetical protein
MCRHPFDIIAATGHSAGRDHASVETGFIIPNMDRIRRCLHRLLQGKVNGVIMHSGNNTAGDSQKNHEQYQPGKRGFCLTHLKKLS